MFDRKNDVARNKKRADAIVYAGAADEVVLTQSDFESEEEFRRWKAWSDADYKQTEKAMRRDYIVAQLSRQKSKIFIMN